MKHIKIFEHFINEANYPATYKIGDTVTYIPMAIHIEKYVITIDDRYGKIVAIRFTEAKVFYDILDDYQGIIFDNVDSSHIINNGDLYSMSNESSDVKIYAITRGSNLKLVKHTFDNIEKFNEYAELNAEYYEIYGPYTDHEEFETEYNSGRPTRVDHKF